MAGVEVKNILERRPADVNLNTVNADPEVSKLENHDEDDEVCCRICRCGEEDDRPLFHPCICTGSIKYVHEECLMEWLSHIGSKNKSKCELCGHYFSFVPIYSPDAPKALSPAEMFRICLTRLIKLVPTFLRVIVVVFAWGVVVPFVTCIWFRWMSLSGSGRMLESAEKNPGWDIVWGWLSLAFEYGYYASWCTGMIVTGCIVASFLALLVVFDYVHGWNDLRFDDLNEVFENENDAENEDDDNNDGEEEEIETDDEVENGNENARNNVIPGRGVDVGNNQNGRVGVEADIHDVAPNGVNENENRNDNDNDIDDNNNQADDRPNVNMQEEIGGGGAEGEVVEINLALDEFVGIRGPILILLHNVTCLILFNCIYLCVVYYCPTTLGAVLLHGFNRFINYSLGIRMLSEEDEAMLLRTESIKNKNQCQVESEGLHDNGISGIMPLYLPDTCPRKSLADTFHERFYWAMLEGFSFAMGHVAIACIFGVSWIVSKKIAKYSRGNRMAKTFWKRISEVFETFGCTMKVAILVVLKMILFPIGLGVLLERSCQSMFAYSMNDRYQFALDRPIYAGMVFWVAGITHMLVITVMVVQLREVLHKDVLQGIIRAHDPNTNLMRILLVEPISNHIRRIVVSCAIYTMLVLLFVYVPLQMVNRLDLFDKRYWPLNPTLSYFCVEIQVPIELTIFHLVALHVLDYCKENVYQTQVVFVGFACRLFGLTRYLLPIRDPEKVISSGDSSNFRNQENLLPRIKPSFVIVRVSCLLIFSWAVCLIGAVAVITLPYILGNAVINVLSMPLTHDPYIYFVGWLVIWRLCVILKGGFLNSMFVVLRRHIDAERRTSLDNLVVCFQWFLLAAVTLLVLPLLVGTLLQIGFLVRGNNPAFSVSSKAGMSEWPFRRAFSGYISILLNAPHDACEESIGTLNMLSRLPQRLGDEWMMGVVVLVIVEQILRNKDIATVLGTRALSIHTSLVEALDDLQEYDCTNLLKCVVLPLILRLTLILSSTIIASMMSDWVVYCLTGTSLCEIYGIALLFRKIMVLLAIVVVLPSVIMQARATLSQLHDALRDEKYLVGRQLLNMEKRIRRNRERSVM